MEKVTIKNLVDFIRKNDKTRITFMNNLKKSDTPDVEKDSESGGDYWISCTSALAHIFETNNKDFIREKNEFLQHKIDATSDLRTKDRFQKNIDLLSHFEDFDFNNIKPNYVLKYLKKSDEKAILKISGLPVHVNPNHVFTFSKNDEYEIGAVWFIAKKGGFSKTELAMFTDVLFRYLLIHYSTDFKINPNYCVAIDVYKTQLVNYKQILNNDISSNLDNAITEFLSFM